MKELSAHLCCLLFLVASFVPLGAKGQDNAATQPDSLVEIQSLPRLKDIYAKDFLIGTCLDFYSPDTYSARDLEVIKSQFDVATPENSMKPGNIHPSEGQWDWAAADALMKFCQENSIQVTGHTLVWHEQTPNWFFLDANGDKASRQQVLARLKEHIETLVGHFKGKVKGWDVVNEVVRDRPDPNTENLRPSRWFHAIGSDYITWAFKYAHEADPNAELYYNDYGIEQGAKHKSSMLLLKRLIHDGAPITAVGIQGHWSLRNLPYKELDQAIADYQSLGLKINISELDVTLTGSGGGQLNPGGNAGASATPASGGVSSRRRRFPTPEQLQAQADGYAKLFQIFQKHKDAIIRVTFWGINDHHSWEAGRRPLLFDGQDNPKPAFRAVVQAKD